VLGSERKATLKKMISVSKAVVLWGVITAVIVINTFQLFISRSVPLSYGRAAVAWETPAWETPVPAGQCMAQQTYLGNGGGLPPQQGNRNVSSAERIFGFPHDPAPLLRSPVCAVSRHVKCTPIQDGTGNTASPPRPKGKALVLYMMHLYTGDEAAREAGNLDHFLRYGLIDEGVSTQLFDGVDFVFSRLVPDITEITMCYERGNVKVLLVPQVPCDLCAHAMVLTYLGYDETVRNATSWPYKSVVMMNSGVRGPFLGRGSSSWIDVVSMAGQPSRSLYEFDESAKLFRTMSVLMLSIQVQFHAQSYFVVVPFSMLAQTFETFSISCVGEKGGCIVFSEIRTLVSVKTRNFRAFATGYNVTVTRENFATVEESLTDYFTVVVRRTTSRMLNPVNSLYIDTCV
jgi:hypothetical protein